MSNSSSRLAASCASPLCSTAVPRPIATVSSPWSPSACCSPPPSFRHHPPLARHHPGRRTGPAGRRRGHSLRGHGLAAAAPVAASSQAARQAPPRRRRPGALRRLQQLLRRPYLPPDAVLADSRDGKRGRLPIVSHTVVLAKTARASPARRAGPIPATPPTPPPCPTKSRRNLRDRFGLQRLVLVGPSRGMLTEDPDRTPCGNTPASAGSPPCATPTSASWPQSRPPADVAVRPPQPRRDPLPAVPRRASRGVLQPGPRSRRSRRHKREALLTAIRGGPSSASGAKCSGGRRSRCFATDDRREGRARQAALQGRQALRDRHRGLAGFEFSRNRHAIERRRPRWTALYVIRRQPDPDLARCDDIVRSYQAARRVVERAFRCRQDSGSDAVRAHPP